MTYLQRDAVVDSAQVLAVLDRAEMVA